MSFDGKALEVMIASPGGLDAERDAVEAVIAEWNALHSKKEKLILIPRRWERDGRVNLDGRAQQMINDDILAGSDIVVGMFHTRIGTATGGYHSGTVEEIKRHHEAGRPVILYFSEAATNPSKIDKDQYAKVEEFKKWAQNQGITGTFETIDQLKHDLSGQMWKTLDRNEYIKSLTSTTFQRVAREERSPTIAIGAPASAAALSDEAVKILVKLAASQRGSMMLRRYIGGNDLLVDSQNLMEDNAPRTVARWRGGVQQLQNLGMIRDLSGKGEVFEMTQRGYEAADRIEG